MQTKILTVGTVAVLAFTAPAFAQSLNKPSLNEVQLDFGKHGLDASHISMAREPNSTSLTSTDVRPIIGHTLVDNSGKSIGFIVQVKNDAKGDPDRVYVQLGKEENAPTRVVPAQTISLRDGLVITSLSDAEVENQ